MRAFHLKKDIKGTLYVLYAIQMYVDTMNLSRNGKEIMA